MINENRLMNYFFELVKIDSETKNEAKIAIYLKQKFMELGLKVVEDDAKNLSGHAANNLICTLHGNMTGKEALFFSSHMDTVTPGVNIQPKIENDYVVSDGTTILGADDKAGIAVMFETIHILKEQGIDHGDIQFIITVGEEAGLAGAKVIDRTKITATSGYVLDSDGAVGNLVNQAPYQSKFHFIIHGKTAHAGIAPEKGISAILVASKAISKMTLGRIDKETTANISFFKGGKKDETNIVTDYVFVEGEARSLNKKKLQEVIDHIDQTVKEIANKYDATAETEFNEIYPGFNLEKSHPVVQLAQSAAKELGFSSEVLQSGGGSDANIFNNIGIPTANLSVGYEYIHTTNERIHKQQLFNLTKLMVEIIKQRFN